MNVYPFDSWEGATLMKLIEQSEKEGRAYFKDFLKDPQFTDGQIDIYYRFARLREKVKVLTCWDHDENPSH